MKRVTVVGSGASGVHFALSLLERGYEVTLLDAGRRGPEPPRPRDDFETLKDRLEDPALFLLGEDFQGVTLPDDTGEFYGFPPSKEHVFETGSRPRVRTEGFAPLFSRAAGGLAQAWTAGVYPFNDAELEPFPFPPEELLPHYGTVARRIGVTGLRDDLAEFMPVHEGLEPPLELDPHSERLLGRYRSVRDALHGGLGCYMGRSRLAVLSRDRGDREREACDYLGRCLWGCPLGALYTPEMTLRECRRYDSFRYVDGVEVEHFRIEGGERGGRASAVTVRDPSDGRVVERPVETLVLAAGTLSSSLIFLESLRRARGWSPRLTGLMDNRQVLVPFLNLGMVGRGLEPRSYQYHQLSMGLRARRPLDYVHCQITTLTTALVHPVLQNMPLDLRTAVRIFRNVRAALGLVNLNFRDTRREDCSVELRDDGDAPPVLSIRYVPEAGEEERIAEALRRVKRALLRLRCVVPPGAVHVRPMGASVHYAGTVPMCERPRPLTASPEGRSHDVDNLFFADGTTFPFLPAKNITFSLMANAVRMAERAF